VLLLITCGEIAGPLNGVEEPILTGVTLSVELGERLAQRTKVLAG